MVAFQAVDPGSTPGRRTLFFLGVFLVVVRLALPDTAPNSAVYRAVDA